MFESIKIKLHSIRVSKKKPKDMVFVNPYANGDVNPKYVAKINPFVTDYGTKKPTGFMGLIKGIIHRKKSDEESIIRPYHRDVPEPPQQPSFISEMKGVAVSDVLFIASKLRLPTKKKERVLTADEILKICEDTKW